MICVPSLMTHASVPEPERLRMGVTNGLVRLSAGIEDAADLVEDLIRALRTGNRDRRPASQHAHA